MVVDLLKQPQTHHLVRSIFIASDKWEQYYPEILRAVGEDESRLPLTLPVTPPVFAACSDTITPQGILAITEIPIFSLERRDAPQNPLYLVLDGVSDPGNLGTLLRSSVATGVAGVLLLPGSCDPWAPKAIRSAMGTTFQIPVETFENWDECREKLVHLGCNNFWAATMLEDGVGRSHYEVNWLSGPNALIIGSEGNGLTKPIRDDLAVTSPRLKSVYVPMKAGIESLNAAVCGSVILFEYMRQGETNVSTK
jgi:TrmH family RNA methyltransferase